MSRAQQAQQQLLEALRKFMPASSARTLSLGITSTARHEEERRTGEPLQQLLPLDGLSGQAPCFPETRPHVLQYSTRPDPAGFGRYLVDSLLTLLREAISWENRVRPRGGWALLENAPDLSVEAFLAERISQVCSMIGALSSEAQAAWRDECSAGKGGRP